MAGLFDIRREERRTTFAAFGTFLLVTTAHTMLETTRDALFLSKIPASRLPWMYLLIVAAALVLARLEKRSKKNARGQQGRHRALHPRRLCHHRALLGTVREPVEHHALRALPLVGALRVVDDDPAVVVPRGAAHAHASEAPLRVHRWRCCRRRRARRRDRARFDESVRAAPHHPCSRRRSSRSRRFPVSRCRSASWRRPSGGPAIKPTRRG